MESQFDDEVVHLSRDIFAAVNYNGEPTQIQLTPRQYKFTREFFTPGNKSLTEVCKKAGISPSTASVWLKDGKFKAWLSEMAQRLRDKKGMTIEQLKEDLWRAFRGEIKKDMTQLKAAELIGKIDGAFQEKMIHESYSKSELVFTQKDDGAQSKIARSADVSGFIESTDNLSDGGEAVGENKPDDLSAITEVQEPRGSSVVCGPQESPGEGHSLGSS